MATIRKLPSGRWNVQVRIAGRKPVSSSHPTRENAEAWARRQEQGHPNQYLETPKQGRPRVNSSGKLAPIYLKDMMVIRGKRRGGYEATMYRLNTLSRYFDSTPIEAITSKDVATYRQKRMDCVMG